MLYFERLQFSMKTVPAHEISDLLDIAENLLDNASTRARIYQRIAVLCERNGDLVSAFMAQWKLWEIASAGREPLAPEHPFGEDAFLTQESDLFSEAGISDARMKVL
jgi:hypothetical protein